MGARSLAGLYKHPQPLRNIEGLGAPVAASSAPGGPEGLESLARELLRAHGLRCAGPRVAVLMSLMAAHRPMSAQELWQGLDAVGINEATIYRTLNTLVEAGVASQVETAGRSRLYEVHAQEDCQSAHAHFICRGCGGMRCLEQLEVAPLAPRALGEGFVVEQSHLLLYGSCPACRKESP